MFNPEAYEILLVEDNLEDTELTVRALQKARLLNPIHVARDGAQALELLLPPEDGRPARLPRLIVLDLKLPKVDGLEVLKRVKGDPRTARIPVVVLTSSREEADVVRSYQLGVNSYVVKPVAFDSFVGVVTQIGQYWLTLNEPPR